MKRSKWYRIRKLACARPNCKVVVTESDTEPRLVGEGSHYKTKGGRYIAYPRAYSRVGWSNMEYYPSTLRVEVGDEWLAKNLTKEEAVAFALDRLTS